MIHPLSTWDINRSAIAQLFPVSTVYASPHQRHQLESRALTNQQKKDHPTQPPTGDDVDSDEDAAARRENRNSTDPDYYSVKLDLFLLQLCLLLNCVTVGAFLKLSLFSANHWVVRCCCWGLRTCVLCLVVLVDSPVDDRLKCWIFEWMMFEVKCKKSLWTKKCNIGGWMSAIRQMLERKGDEGWC